MNYAEESLKKHYEWKGKIEIKLRADVDSDEALSLAYTPGVAQPCLEIQKDINKSYDLTRRWNTVAVVTDGTAVLGLGDIGPEAGMPVMEGKCALFKAFGDVDAIPLCIRSKDPDDIVKTVSLLAGSFGGINLEDISAPRCFEIEEELKKVCDIPVFHDDQHGTAVITMAGLINALKVVGKDIHDIKIVTSGAGAAGIAIIKLMMPVSVLAALLNSVNVVAMFIDTVKIWARRIDISPSRLLLPLSYAATLGGTCTLLGNSSNLVIAGLYMEKTGHSLSLFQPLVPGLVITFVGVILVVMLRRFIPERESPEQSFETTSDYTVELLVPTDNQAVGLTVGEAGLQQVKGGSLIEIVRFDKEIIMPVPDDEFILGGDRLIYAGQINEILDLKRSHGFVAADHHVYNISEIDSDRKLRTAYVTFGSDLIGTSMTEMVQSALFWMCSSSMIR